MAKLDLNKLKGGTPAPSEPAKPASGLAFLQQRKAAAEEPKPEPAQTDTQAESIAEPAAPASPEPKKAGGLGFLMGKGKTVASTPTPSPTPSPSPSPAPAKPASPDLEALMDSETGGGSKPNLLASGRVSRFADEEPAQAPERELPGEPDKSMLQFVESLDSVYKIVHEPDLLGGVIKNIMIELAQKPEYRKLIQPKDVHTMIKGMRDSMGMARIKKEESKAKRGGKKTSAKKIDDIETLAALDEAFAGVDFS